MISKKKLGIIGGLGPAASAHFYQTITRLTKADCDQQHIEIALLSRPAIPNRSAFITGDSDINPLPAILNAADSLCALEVDYIAIPCVTAHYFMPQIREYCKADVVSIVEETIAHLKRKAITAAGILATDGTIASGLFQTALEADGILPITPDLHFQKGVMDIINAIKAGEPVKRADFRRVAENCLEKGAEVVLLACTELPLVNTAGFTGDIPLADCIELLARRVVLLCGGELR